jgi:nitrogenase iron protein NifH
VSRQERIAIYGKGGVGKSVVATNLSVCYARQGLRVLHIGCDPKHDSSVRLLDPETPCRTVLELLGERPSGLSGRDVLNAGRLGIACCESGGPEPGVGCAGRGVARTLEFLEEVDLLAAGGYDVVLFDVLGDVVCGGFAAPLRAGFARKVVVVTSEEPMSLFAANNICRAVRTYAENGVVLAGLVANLRCSDADRRPIDVFAGLIATRVLATLKRDERIGRAERRMRTLVEHAPRSDTAHVFDRLARMLLELDPDSLQLPNPLSDREFFRFAADAAAPDA